MSNCWWLWALSVWKLFRACKDASINKHLNSYVCSVYPNAFSVPMKAILAGCGGHTFNPSGQQKQANLYETSLVYIASSVQVSQKENLLFPTCLLIDYSHTYTHPISLLYLSCASQFWVCVDLHDFPSQAEVWAFHTMTCTFLCTRGRQKWHFSGLHVKPSKAEALGKAELEQFFCLWFNKWFISF